MAIFIGKMDSKF